MSAEASREEFHKRTGGFIAPVSLMEYEQDGRVYATFPHGGLTVLDQFAIAFAAELAVFHGSVSSKEWVADTAYEMAEAMLAKKRQIERT